MIFDSRKKFIAILVDVYKKAGYNLVDWAKALGISFAKLMKWMVNSPDLEAAVNEADNNKPPRS